MGVHLSPVGPLPASVYWRRRAVLLLGLLALLFLLSRCANGEDEQPAAEALVPTSVSSSSPVAPSPSLPPTLSPVPSASPTTTTAGATCADEDLAVTADADRARYEVGARPQLTLRIENRSAVPCRRGIGAGSVELQVRSGGDRIWSSDDCGGTGRAGVTTLEPGDPKAATVSWNARRSRPGCTGAAGVVAPGTYQLFGRVGELVVRGDVFTVVR